MGFKATADNTAYTAHFVRPNIGYAETSYMLEMLYAIPKMRGLEP